MEQKIAESVLFYKTAIDSYISLFLGNKRKSIGQISPRALTILGYMHNTIHLGKSLRGCLVMHTAKLYGFQNLSKLIPIAAAIEMLHYGFLVQDDVMDDDMMRRGEPTVYAQYQTEYKPLGVFNSKRLAGSSANLVGDIAFFFAFELVGASGLSTKIKQQMSEFISKEAVLVGLGQFDDVYFSLNNQEPSLQIINTIYLNKTARYTGSVPMTLGAMAAGVTALQKKHIEKLGQELGMLFQLRDDELNLAGDQRVTGKSVGSDIREGKKTFIRHYLAEHARQTGDNLLQSVLGGNISERGIAHVMTIVNSDLFRAILEKLKNEHCRKADKQVAQLALSQERKSELSSLVTYIAQRDK